MKNAKKLVNKSSHLTTIATLLVAASFLTCEKVYDHCGAAGDDALLKTGQFCFGFKAHDLCGGREYNPNTQACIAGREIGTLCEDGRPVSIGTLCGRHTLTIITAPPQGGSIFGADSGSIHDADAQVSLFANANTSEGFTFVRWTGADTSSSEDLNVRMTRGKSVIAVFRPSANSLYTTVFPPNAGSVTRVPDLELYPPNAEVEITASPNDGFYFVRWEGAQVANNANPATTVTMSGGQTLVAIFAPRVYKLTVESVPETGGAVFVNGTALMTAEDENVGSMIEIFARPEDGFEFVRWTSSPSVSFVDANSAATLFPMPASDVTITAIFERRGDGGSSVDPPIHVTFFCPAGCLQRSGVSRPGHCFADQDECLGAGNIDTLPPPPPPDTTDPWVGFWCLIDNGCAAADAGNWNVANCHYATENDCQVDIVIDNPIDCTRGLDCPDDGGSCTVSGACTDNVQRENCAAQAGAFVFGEACPVTPPPTDPWVGFWCLIDNGCAAADAGNWNVANCHYATENDCQAAIVVTPPPPDTTDPWVGYWCLIDNGCAAADAGNWNIANCHYATENDCQVDIVIDNPPQYITQYCLAGDCAVNTSFTTLQDGCYLIQQDCMNELPPPPLTPGGQFNPSINYGSFTDNRDGQTYRTVVMPDGKTWMAENLNFAVDVDSSWCYDNDSAYCDLYGRLYNWPAAMNISQNYLETLWSGSDANHQGVCPAGWHLPSQAEWEMLVDFVGGWDIAGSRLKSQIGWIPELGINNTDTYGFSALPGGYRHRLLSHINEGYTNDGGNGMWWSATELIATNANDMVTFHFSDAAGSYNGTKNVALSVRCVMD